MPRGRQSRARRTANRAAARVTMRDLHLRVLVAEFMAAVEVARDHHPEINWDLVDNRPSLQLLELCAEKGVWAIAPTPLRTLKTRLGPAWPEVGDRLLQALAQRTP